MSGQMHTEREALEYQMIEKGVVLDTARNQFDIKYAFLEDPRILKDNFGQVVGIAMREEDLLV